MRALFLSILVALGLCAPVAAADDFGCIATYLSGSSYALGKAKSLTREAIEIAERFRTELDLDGKLPALSAETLTAWCAFLSGEGGADIQPIVALTDYPVAIKGLEEIDDGIGKVPFDFKPFKLTARYDGQTCFFALATPLRMAEGQFRIEGGHLFFGEGKWNTGGSATPETFRRFNLALTEEGALVGKFPAYLNIIEQGQTAREAFMLVSGPKSGTLAKDQPIGTIALKAEVSLPVRFHILKCWLPDEAEPKQYEFDFSKFKLDTKLPKTKCIVSVATTNEPDNQLADATLLFEKGLGRFLYGRWMTDWPPDSFKLASLGLTTDHKLVGVMDVHWMYYEASRYKPEATVSLSGKESKLAKGMPTGSVTFAGDVGTDVKFDIVSCKEIQGGSG
jgi:hypothetical protein